MQFVHFFTSAVQLNLKEKRFVLLGYVRIFLLFIYAVVLAERCSEDSISNLVPIIVGACLGGLIIIVLIAYLIGRKRSRRGYESV